MWSDLLQCLTYTFRMHLPRRLIVVHGAGGESEKGKSEGIFLINRGAMMNLSGRLYKDLKDHRKNQGVQVKSTNHDEEYKENSIDIVGLVVLQPNSWIDDCC